MAEKAAIVAESQVPGAQASEIALRYGLDRNQLYGWRREFGAAVDAMAAAGAPGPDFVALVADAGSGVAAIEIELGSAIVRVRAGVDLAVLGKVLRLLARCCACWQGAAPVGKVLRLLKVIR